jgi:hypothetical protein
MTKTFSAASHNGKVHPTRVRLATTTGVMETAVPTRVPNAIPGPQLPSATRLSVNISSEISKRLRLLAHTHRLSESSIVEVALAMFVARGDDAALGLLLRKLGATLRRK